MFVIIFYMSNVLCSNINQEDLSYPSDRHLIEFLSSKGFTNPDEILFKNILGCFTKIISIFRTIELIEKQININLTHLKHVEQEYFNTKTASDNFTAKNKELFEILKFQYHHRDAKTQTIVDENGKEITVFDNESILKHNIESTTNPSLTISGNQKKSIVKFDLERVTSGLNKCYKLQQEHEQDMELIHQSVTQKLELLRKIIIDHDKHKRLRKDQITDECIKIFDLIHTVDQSLVREVFVVDFHNFCWKIQEECDISGFITRNSITIFV